MRIEIRTQGGIAAFPGLSTPRVLETDAAPAEVADELAQLVEAADFFKLPSRVSSLPPGAADFRYVAITVEDEARSHTVEAVEPIDDAALRRLIDRVRDAAR